MKKTEESKKIKVLFIIWSLGLGGAERVVIELCQSMQYSSIYKPIICCLNEKGIFADSLKKENIKIISLFKKPKFDPYIIIKIMKVIKRENIEIVHTHLWTSNFWGRIAAYLAGVKVIIATEHTTDESRPWFYYTSDKFLSKITNKIITVSKSVRNFHSIKTKINKHKFKVIYNGIDYNKFNKSLDTKMIKKQLGIKDSEQIVGTIGRLVPAKKYDVFLKSLSSVFQQKPQIKAVIVGEGPLEEELRKLSMQLGIANKVIFTGLRKDIPDLLNIFNVFVLTSKREGLSITLLEAMAAGVPCVVTNVGGNPEVVTNGKNGYIVEYNNTQQLSDSILKLLNEPELHKKFSSAAKERIRNKFSKKSMVNRTKALYTKLLGRNLRRKTKLLFIIDHLDSGGAQRQMIELIKYIAKNIYDITVCNLDKEKKQYQKELELIGINVFGLSQYGKLDLEVLISLYKFIKKYRFHIVHTYLFTADCYGRIAAIFAKTPIIIASMRSIDAWKKWYHIFVDRLLTIFTDKIIINANSIKTFLHHKEKISLNKIKTIYNGVNIKKFEKSNRLNDVREKYNINDNDYVIGILARNDKVKDHKTYFKAAKIIHAKVERTKFLAIGYGMKRDNIQDMVKNLDLEDCVVLDNYVSDIKSILEIIDISVLTSLVEGCPNFILESMAMGIPIVATNVGGIPELVVNKKTGYLINPGNPAELADKIIKLLKDPTQRKRMGINAQKRINKQFSMQKMVQETEKLYNSLIMSKWF